MSYKIKVLLTKNDGDWRRRSAVILKAKSTTTFSEFVTQCAHKLYPNQSNKIYSNIKLYDIQNGLTPIDDEPNTLLSELHEDHDIYRNCQILVILPLFHTEGIMNPSEEQRIELQQEKQLSSYVSSPSTSVSSHPLYASSSSVFSPSIQSTPRPFHTLASLNNANNSSVGNNHSLSPKIKEPRHILSLHSDTKDNKVAVKPHTVDDDEEDDELVCTLRNEDDASEVNRDSNSTQRNDGITGKRARTEFKPSTHSKRPRKKRKKRHKHKDNVDIYDDTTNLKVNDTERDIDKNKNTKNKSSLCTNSAKPPTNNGKDAVPKKQKHRRKSKTNDENEAVEVKQNEMDIIAASDNNKPTAKEIAINNGYWECSVCCFINCPSNKKCMVCQLLPHLSDTRVIDTDAVGNKNRNRGNDTEQPSLSTVESTRDKKAKTRAKRKNTKTKKSDKEEMDEESGDDDSSTEYEEIVEYMMLEMKVGNSDSFNLHQYDQCILKNMLKEKQMLPSITLKNKAHEEYEGIYCQTLGSHLFFKQMNICDETEHERDIHDAKEQNQMEYVNKADMKCVFSRFKPRVYS